LDKDFFAIIEYTAQKGIQPVIFTDGATMMRDLAFIKRVKDLGASVVPKCDSLYDNEYQNWVVGDETGRYFYERNEVIELLIDEGFNKIEMDGTTRLGFDMVISRGNLSEVADTLTFCRQNNLWIVFSFYLPAGRSGSKEFEKYKWLVPSEEEKTQLRRTIEKIDRNCFGFVHPVLNNFVTMPCVERLQIYGDGRVSPCPGNETCIGHIQTDSIGDLSKKILVDFPGHNPECFEGHCLYRPRIKEDN